MARYYDAVIKQPQNMYVGEPEKLDMMNIEATKKKEQEYETAFEELMGLE